MLLTRLWIGLCSVALAAPAAWCAEPAPAASSAWTTTFATDFRLYSWQGTRGSPTTFNTSSGSGSQIYVPLALAVNGKPASDVKLDFLIRGGWVSARQTTAGLTGSVQTFTDTVMSGTATYLGFTGIQPFAGLSVNAPSGRSALYGSAAAARMDPDLVEIASFGEGWNVGPTVGANFPITSALMITASVGYTWRGNYDRERPTNEPSPFVQSTTRINPGDVVTGTASLAYQAAPWSFSLSGSISEEGTTQENAVDLYKPGRRYLGSATVAYSWPDKWGQTTLTGSVTHQNRNDVKFTTIPSLLTELMNTNSNLYRAGIQHLFAVSQTFVIGPTANYLHRDSNSYDAGTLQFLPAKDRIAAGAMARYAVSDSVTLNFRGEHVWTRENERTAPNNQQFSVLANSFVAALPVPVVSSTGWVFVGGLNAKF